MQGVTKNMFQNPTFFCVIHNNRKQVVGSSSVKLEGKGWYTAMVIACVAEHSIEATYTHCMCSVP